MLERIFGVLGDVLMRMWTKDSDRSSMRRMFALMFHYKGVFLLALLGMVAYNFFNALPAWYSKDIVDGLRAGKVPTLDRFALVGLAIFVIFFIKGVFYFIHNYLLGWIGQRMVYRLREQLYARLQSMPFTFFVRNRPGELISRFTSDLLTLQNAIRLSLVGPFRDLPMIFAFIGILGYRSWQLLLVSGMVIPLAMGLIYIFGQRNKLATGQRLESFGRMSSLLTETMGGIRVVKTFGMEGYERHRFDLVNKEIMNKYMHTVRVSSYSHPILEVVGASAGSVIIMVGGYLIIQQVITPGDFVSFLLAFFMLNIPLRRLNGFNLSIQEGLAAVQRIFEMLDHPGGEEDRPQTKILPPVKESLHLQIRRFQHTKSEAFQLHDIDVRVSMGKMIALVGPSGAGKTTLANMIPRFFEPQDGCVMIDGADVRNFSYASLRSKIAMINQEVFLFNDTVANNIAYGKIDCPHKSIIAAAKAAHAHDFIMALPQRYETMIGEGGLQLSGGQRQRLCIARALIKDAPILILDEATSALDSESEQAVQLAISNLVQNRTTVVIAHRLSTIRQADYIYVMRNGTVAESGTHLELLEKGGSYKRIHQIQFQGQAPFTRSVANWRQWLAEKMGNVFPEVEKEETPKRRAV